MSNKSEKDNAVLENTVVAENKANVENTQSSNTQASTTSSSSGAGAGFKIGDVRMEHIRTCVPIIPNKGTNAGRQMFLVNGEYWLRHEPNPTHNTIVLTYGSWVDKTTGEERFGWNVSGTNTDASMMSIDQKIAKITSVDAAYSNALALLMR